MNKAVLLLLIGVFVIAGAGFALEDPVLYFSFDVIDGDTVKDLSPFGNDGTMQNNPKVIDGVSGKALEFQNSRVRIAASDSLTTEIFKEGVFSLLLWVNPPLSGNTWQQIFRAGPDPNDTLFLNVDGRLSWRGWVGAAWGGGLCETDPGVLEKDKWTHVAVTSDAANFRIYVNGELAKESEFKETRGNNQEYMIGGYSGGESYTGAVDEFIIYKATLGENDVISIMNNGPGAAVEPMGKLATQWGALKF